MITPLSEKSPEHTLAENKPTKNQTDKEKRLAHALRQNLLRRKAANTASAEGTGQ